ncbi:MAG: leucine-rich repeat protein, partial [Rikenellaceae bacterium]
IGDNAFSNDGSLESVSLPNAKTIGESAFNFCTNLESVSVPAAETIGECAFNCCTSLESVELGTTAESKLSLGTDIFNEVTTTDVTLTTGKVNEDYVSDNTFNGYEFKKVIVTE